jgi:hypothetical protein
MADFSDLDQMADERRPSRVIALLDALGWIVLIGPVLAGAFLLYNASQSDLPAETLALRWIAAAGMIIAGPALGVLLWGIGELVRRNVRLEELSEDLANAVAEQRAERTRSREEQAEREHTFDELVLLLREVRDISLLDPEQRMLRLKAQGQATLERLRREVPMLLREHNWIEARNRVQDAWARFPTFSEWRELERQIENVRRSSSTTSRPPSGRSATWSHWAPGTAWRRCCANCCSGTPIRRGPTKWPRTCAPAATRPKPSCAPG